MRRYQVIVWLCCQTINVVRKTHHSLVQLFNGKMKYLSVGIKQYVLDIWIFFSLFQMNAILDKAHNIFPMPTSSVCSQLFGKAQDVLYCLSMCWENYFDFITNLWFLWVDGTCGMSYVLALGGREVSYQRNLCIWYMPWFNYVHVKLGTVTEFQAML